MKRKILKKSNYYGQMHSVIGYDGETIESKCARISETGEPITDGAPLIYTQKKHGVLPQYNIRVDKWELAQEAMQKVNKAKIAKGQSIENEKTEKETAKAAEDKKTPSTPDKSQANV